jgi:hypothetical protein
MTSRTFTIALIVAGALLRLAYAFRHQVNTDEPQHLHIAWGWTQGLLAYRDIFDNHSPLFSMAFAPLLSALGERADIIVLMRLAMIPLTFLTLWALWVITRRLFGPQEALWAVAIAGVHPDFIQRAVEYRADDLWMALWLCTLAVLLAGRASRVRMFAGGFLLGATFGASMKTILLALALALAALATLGLIRARDARLDGRRLATFAACATIGMIVVPGLIVGFNLLHHALGPLVYCVVGHNVVPGLGLWGRRAWLPLLMVPAVTILVWVATFILRSASHPRVGARRSVLFLTATIYWLEISTLWPIATRQDWLPFIPMAAALSSPFLLWIPRAFRDRSSATRALARALYAVQTLIVGAEIASVFASEPLWSDKARIQRDELSEVLRLTAPCDSVMDLRGEAVYRARPCYYVFEDVTVARMKMGILSDSIPERLVSGRTAVVYRDSEDFPPRARQFMNDQYLSVGTWRVAGRLLHRRLSSPGDVRSFEVEIPQRYAVVIPKGPARGRLDGTAYLGARQLARGPHTYRAAPGEGAVAVIWAQAAERGFSPFPRVSADR